MQRIALDVNDSAYMNSNEMLLYTRRCDPSQLTAQRSSDLPSSALRWDPNTIIPHQLTSLRDAPLRAFLKRNLKLTVAAPWQSDSLLCFRYARF